MIFTNGDTGSISQYSFDPQTGTVTIDNYYFVWREYYTFNCYYYASNSHTARVTITKNGVHYGYVVADNPNMFPADGMKNGCWYELIGAVNMASNGILNSRVNEIKNDAVNEIQQEVVKNGKV